MKKLLKAMAAGIMAGAFLNLVPYGWSAEMAPLKHLPKVTLIADPANDGDSFLIQTPEKKLRVRLYFVDAPETGAYWDSDLRRIREQMRYFGLSTERNVLDFGAEAARFTKEQLAQPFDVYTSFASALGRSTDGRVYAFVRTASGNDLAELLVKNGLARTYGVGREGPDGATRDEIKAHMTDLEATAMLKNKGLWKASDPDLLADLRAAQRHEDQEVKDSLAELVKPSGVEYPLALNTCSIEDLQTIRGIGPSTAQRIIAGRPYRKMEDLLNVSGITTGNLEAWRPLLIVK